MSNRCPASLCQTEHKGGVWFDCSLAVFTSNPGPKNLAVNCTAGLRDVNRADTSTIAAEGDCSPTALGEPYFSAAKEVFLWPEGTKEPRVSV